MASQEPFQRNFEEEPINKGLEENAANLLSLQNLELDKQVKSALTKKIEIHNNLEIPHYDSYAINRVKKEICDLINDGGYDPSLLTIGPPTQKNDVTQNIDLAFNIASIAKDNNLQISEASEGIANIVEHSATIVEAIPTGAFINIKLDIKKFAPQVISEITKYGERFGHYRNGNPEVVIVDYSSPNVAKNMTVAHLRSTIIGQSLMKLQEAAGNIPFGINHIGDWGTQFGGILYQYQKEMESSPEEFSAALSSDPTDTLMTIYRKFNEDKKNNPSLSQEAAKLFLMLERGDPKLLALWNQFREWSIRDFGPTYDRLNVQFDAIQGESFYEDKMIDVVNEGVNQGILALRDDGSIVFPSQDLVHPVDNSVNKKAMLDKDGLPKDEIIVKPNGGTVYLTRDLAAIKYRTKELGATKILYVIGKEQQVHCLELFNIAHQLGYIALGDAQHVSFGHLNVDGRKMKSREGKVVLLKDLLDDMHIAAAQYIKDIISEREGGNRNDTFSDEEIKSLAGIIGTSSLIYNDLKQDRTKDIEFNENISQKAEKTGAAYIQYTNTRLKSIMRNCDDIPELTEVPDRLIRSEEKLIMKMAGLPEAIKEANKYNAPHKIAAYLTEFCQEITQFYNQAPILSAPDNVTKVFRLNLVRSAQQVIENAAYLLHIELPERM